MGLSSLRAPGVVFLPYGLFIQDCGFSWGLARLPMWRLYELLYFFIVLKILEQAKQLILKGIYLLLRHCCCCYGWLGPL